MSASNTVVMPPPPPPTEIHQERTVPPSVTKGEQQIVRKMKAQSNPNMQCDAEGDSFSAMTQEHVSNAVGHLLAAQPCGPAARASAQQQGLTLIQRGRSKATRWQPVMSSLLGLEEIGPV